MAEAFRCSGDFDEADIHYREALRIANDPEYGTTHDQAAYTGNLVALEIARRNWPEANKLAEKALDLAQGRGERS